MATCLETYMQACDAADQIRDNTIALCGTQACIENAINAHLDAITAAVEAYKACVSGGGGGGGGN